MQETTPGQDPTQGQAPTAGTVEPTPQTATVFDADYVKQLRQEAAANRVAANEAAAKLAELEAAQAERERQEAERKGEFETLYRQTQTEYEQVKTELEILRTFKSSVDEREEAERVALLSKLPDDVRTAFESATSQQIRVVLDKLAAPGSSPAGNRQPPRPGAPEAGTPPALRPGQPGWLAQQLAGAPTP